MHKVITSVLALIIFLLAVYLSQPTSNQDLQLDYEAIPEIIETSQVETIVEEPIPQVNEFSYEDAQLLLKVGQAEAGNQGPDGIWLVMSVVLNRVESETFPDTIEGVLSQSGQFSTYKHLDKVEPCADCHEALARIERGEIAPDIIGFETTNSNALDRYFKYVYSFRDHKFYKLKEETDG